MKKIRWGIIGCGDVTEIKSGPAFQIAAGSELVAVMRRNGELAKDYARRHQVPKWYKDAYSLISDPDVNAVYIATPPSTHKKYTLLAAQAGKPVYVEKPMAVSYAECMEMISACEKEHVPLFVAYYRRALPRFLKIKSLLTQGKIGKVQSVKLRYYQKPFMKDQKGEIHWRVQPEIAGCGYFCDLGSHMLDLLLYFIGPVESAIGSFSNIGKLYKAEDSVSAVFKFKTGVLGSGIWSFNSSVNLDKTEIVGTKGKISYATFADEPIYFETKDDSEEIKIENPKHIQQHLIQLIVDDLLGKGRCPSTGITGSETNWMIDKILNRL